MGVSSETQIMNSALSKLGAERISSPDDQNNRARLMKAQYPILRDAATRAHPWKFATTYVELAEISPTPADIFDFDHVFQLPIDCLRVIKTDLCPEDEWEEIKGRRIACNVSTLFVKYISKVTDVTKFDDDFVEYLALMLAADTAYAITQNATLQGLLEQKAEKKLKEARSFNAQIGSVPKVYADEWLNSRR